jgi:hypothetical protein
VKQIDTLDSGDLSPHAHDAASNKQAHTEKTEPAALRPGYIIALAAVSAR